MISRLRAIATCLALASFVAANAADTPDVGAHAPSQDAADLIRAFAGSDAAFLAAGLVRESFEKDNLATLLQYPTDEVVVLELTGAQIKQAFERSVALFPQPNQSFLQISGFEVVFNKTAPSLSRIVSVTANGSKLDEAKTYTVAMPSSLARGGLGYFKIWDKSRIVKTFEGKKVEDVLRGKPSVGSAPRWSAQ